MQFFKLTVNYLDMNNTDKKQNDETMNTRENSVGWMIKSLSSKLDESMLLALKPLGLNLSQFGILMTLLENDGLSQSEIGKRISIPGYATTRNIDGLENNGLVERKQHASSRRSFSIQLTQQAKQLAPTLFSIINQTNEKHLSALDESEKEQLKYLINKTLK